MQNYLNKTDMPERILANTSTDEVSVNEFLTDVESRLNQGLQRIQIDCKALIRVTSRNIYALWQAREKCLRRNSSLELTNVSIGLRRVLEALDLAEIFLNEPISIKKLHLSFPPKIEEIDQAMSSFVTFLLKAKVPEITAFELQTIFYEVATNIRRHAKMRSNEKICFEAHINARTVEFIFIDKGYSFNPLQKNTNIDFQKASQENQRNGFGLAMIERLSDGLEYQRTTKAENLLKIKKAW